MIPPSILIYDTEIQRAVITKPEEQEQAREIGIQFVASWGDFAGMGVACLCAPTLSDCLKAESGEMLYKESMHFTESHLGNVEWYFEQFAYHVSFNGEGFDAPLLKANGVFLNPKKSYDILSHWRYATGKRIKMDDLAKANGLTGKSGSGADAPLLFQRRQMVELLTYCYEDCRQTGLLFAKILRDGFLLNPDGRKVKLPQPGQAEQLF